METKEQKIEEGNKARKRNGRSVLTLFTKSCDGYRYGFTKEQLIKIIAQLLKTTLWNDRIGLTYEQIAQKIFEGIVNKSFKQEKIYKMK